MKRKSMKNLKKLVKMVQQIQLNCASEEYTLEVYMNDTHMNFTIYEHRDDKVKCNTLSYNSIPDDNLEWISRDGFDEWFDAYRKLDTKIGREEFCKIYLWFDKNVDENYYHFDE